MERTAYRVGKWDIIIIIIITAINFALGVISSYTNTITTNKNNYT